MKKIILALAALTVITATNPTGFTFSLKTGTLSTHGYAVALAATQNSFGEEGLLNVVSYAIEHDIECIGAWLDTESGLCYYDATVICDNLEDAIALGKANGQLAIFDLNSYREIRL